jgi:prephenate dehydrogenase
VTTARTLGPVKIVGTGLIGTSIGLALREQGVTVLLEDQSPAVLDLAIDFGAGVRAEGSTYSPELVVVCVPPDITAKVVAEQLESNSNAVVTDVASVKYPILTKLVELGSDLSRYVGSHPMAGREQSGALAGRSDIFIGRPWVISANENSSKQAISSIEALALDLGAILVAMSPLEHDRAVALVSHAPQLISSLLAARLAESEPLEVSLAGQGLRDTTRIAASDPKLWMQILTANKSEVLKILRLIRSDLDDALLALENLEQSGSISKIGRLLEKGNQGVGRIPGKHGSRATEYSKITVMIDDKPGELARLLTEIGEAGINLEDLTLEHATGALVGLPELYVLPSAKASLLEALNSRGWKIVG